MAAIHYSKDVPASHEVSRVLIFIGQSAPAFFFFAFGITFDRFLAKNAREKFQLHVLFLYVALMHNIFTKSLFRFEFLAVLCLWRVILSLLEARSKRSNRFYLLICAAAFLAPAVNPPEFYLALASWLAKGLTFRFTPVLWSVFVLMGLVYSRTGSSRVRSAYAALLLALSAIFYFLDLAVGYDYFKFSKEPLTTPYVVFFCAMNVLLLEGLRVRLPRFLQRPRVSRLMVFISKNLLLGTVLHYVPLIFMANILAILVEKKYQFLPSIERYDYGYIAAGSLLMISATVILLALIPRMWRLITPRLLSLKFTPQYHAGAVALIASATVLMRFRKLGPWDTAFQQWAQLHLPHVPFVLLQKGITLYPLFIMIYLTLAMMEYRFVAKSPEPGPRVLAGAPELPS